MSSNDNQNDLRKAIQIIAAIIGLMIAVFTFLSIFLPTGLVQPIGTVVIGLMGTAILVWWGKLNWGGAILTWLVVSMGIIILYLIISRPATVVGSVVDSGGAELQGLTLILTDADGIDHKAVTDQDGAFEIRNVSEGKFTILAEGELLISGQIPSGWKRIVDSTLYMGEPVHRPSSIVATVTPNTPTPVAVSNTPVPPTDTPTPEPTNTPVPPTVTLTPVPPTDTPIPPTNTPTLTPTPTPHIIDNMDSMSGWEQYIDDKGSSMFLRSMPGITGNAIELSFDLKTDGYVGISKELYSGMLSGTQAMAFSYNGSGTPNTIELKLLYRPNITGTSIIYSVEWYQITATNNWETFEVPYSDFKCWADTGCGLNEKIDLEKVWKVDFAISNKSGGTPGIGVIAIDNVQGIDLY